MRTEDVFLNEVVIDAGDLTYRQTVNEFDADVNWKKEKATDKDCRENVAALILRCAFVGLM